MENQNNTTNNQDTTIQTSKIMSTSKSPLAIATELRDLDFSVFPLADRGSPYETDAQGRFILNGKGEKIKTSANPALLPDGGHFKWKEFQTRLPTEDEIDLWFSEKWPCANVGLVTGKISNLVVLDADSEQALAWVSENCPSTPWQVVTNRGKHFYFKYPSNLSADDLRELRAKLAPIGLDLQADGHYVCAYGSVHSSGSTYELQAMLDWQDVPEFSIEATDIAQSNDKLYKKIIASSNMIYDGLRNNTLTSYTGYLFALKKSEEVVFNTVWSINQTRCYPPLSKKEIQAIVKSIAKGDRERHPENYPEIEVSDINDFNNELKEDDIELDLNEKKEIDDYNEKIFKCDGLLDDLFEYQEKVSPGTPEIYRLCGAISLVGTTVGRKIISPTGLTTNLYNIAVGPSGSGKDTPKSLIIRVLNNCGYGLMKNLFGGNAISSTNALIDFLNREDNHICIFVFDELGNFFKSSKNKNSLTHNLPSLLTELFSSTDGSYKQALCGNGEYDRIIEWSSLNLFGSTVPESLYDSIDQDQTTNGFLARLSIYESNQKSTQMDIDFNNTQALSIPQDIENKLLTLHKKIPPFTKPEKDKLRQVIKPIPFVIHLTDEANGIVKGYKDTIGKLLDKFKDSDKYESIISIFNRAQEKIVKLSLVHYASRTLLQDVENEKIELEDVEWASLLEYELDKRLINNLETSLAKNDFDAESQKVFKYIKKSIDKANDIPGAQRSHLLKHMKMTQWNFDNLINTLVESGLIKPIKYKPKSGKKSATFYCLIKHTN